MQEAIVEAQKKSELDLNIFIGKYKEDPYLPYGVRRVARRLLKHAINIYEYNGKGNIHYKDMVVDDYVFIKTANGEGRSRYYNLETGVILKSPELARVIKKRIQMDLNSSVQVELNTDFLQKQSAWQRVKGISLCPLYYHHL
jgi:phosphatidylserine/phosphatidylglycerophosphate/cardiolipin synthase-like enzyme